MNCPDCGHDNIEGVDICEQCGQSLATVSISRSQIELSISSHPIELLTKKKPLSVDQATPIRKVVKTMSESKTGCVLVMENNLLVGIFTERDLLNKVSVNSENLNCPVGEFMTPTPETVRNQDSIGFALHTMDSGGYRHLPVVGTSEKPEAIISVRDILRYLCIRFAKIRSEPV